MNCDFDNFIYDFIYSIFLKISLNVSAKNRITNSYLYINLKNWYFNKISSSKILKSPYLNKQKIKIKMSKCQRVKVVLFNQNFQIDILKRFQGK